METMDRWEPEPAGDARERATRQDGSDERAGHGGGREASWPAVMGHSGAPVRAARVPEEPGGEWLVMDFPTGNGSREGRCDGSRKNTARTNSGPAVPDGT